MFRNMLVMLPLRPIPESTISGGEGITLIGGTVARSQSTDSDADSLQIDLVQEIKDVTSRVELT